jgi:hypothetical protein
MNGDAGGIAAMAQTQSYKSAFGHRLYNWLDDRHVPWAYGIRIVRGAKTLKSPREYLQRKAEAARVDASSPYSHMIKEADGYCFFRPDQLPGAKETASACAAIFDELQESGALQEARGNKKKHLRAIVKGEEFARYPEIGRFALSQPVLDATASYFGSAAILSSICLFWSLKTDTVISSQKYHVDGEDVRQLKLWVNVWDVTEEHGPLTFYSASDTDEILKNCDRQQKLNLGNINFNDDFVQAHAKGRTPVQALGEAGSGLFIDTSRCLHFGSRRNSKERLMLMIQYAPYNLARESTIDLGSTDWIPYERDNTLQRLALQK